MTTARAAGSGRTDCILTLWPGRVKLDERVGGTLNIFHDKLTTDYIILKPVAQHVERRCRRGRRCRRRHRRHRLPLPSNR